VAVVNRKADSFVINGIIATNIPLVIISEDDPCSLIRSDNRVKVDAQRGFVEVYEM